MFKCTVSPIRLHTRACSSSPARHASTPPCHAETLGTSFALVRSDVGGNIDRLRDRQATDPRKYELVSDIVLAEIAVGSQNGSSSATKGLLWLKRHVNCPACSRSPDFAWLANNPTSHPYQAPHLPDICGCSRCCQQTNTSALPPCPQCGPKLRWCHGRMQMHPYKLCLSFMLVA